MATEVDISRLYFRIGLSEYRNSGHSWQYKFLLGTAKVWISYPF